MRHVYCIVHEDWHVASRSRRYLRWRKKLHNLRHGPIR